MLQYDIHKKSLRRRVILSEIIYLLFAYLVGTVMTAFVVMKLVKGKDIRDLGSGNVGARNIGRFLGKKYFVVTFLGDGLKGVIIVLGAKYLLFPFEFQALALLMVVIGHIWPITLKFKGGKGISTFVGGFLALDYMVFSIFALIFVIFYVVLRSLTYAGMIAFVTVPFLVFFFDYSLFNCMTITITIVLLIFVHRKNLNEKLSKGR